MTTTATGVTDESAASPQRASEHLLAGPNISQLIAVTAAAYATCPGAEDTQPGAKARALASCWLAITMAFVALNGVVTAQYFTWWWAFLPLLPALAAGAPPEMVRFRDALAFVALWVAAHGGWLAAAYQLEFTTPASDLPSQAAVITHLASCAFTFAHCVLSAVAIAYTQRWRRADAERANVKSHPLLKEE